MKTELDIMNENYAKLRKSRNEQQINEFQFFRQVSKSYMLANKATTIEFDADTYDCPCLTYFDGQGEPENVNVISVTFDDDGCIDKAKVRFIDDDNSESVVDSLDFGSIDYLDFAHNIINKMNK